jgi:hypothetical protein
MPGSSVTLEKGAVAVTTTIGQIKVTRSSVADGQPAGLLLLSTGVRLLQLLEGLQAAKPDIACWPNT